MHISIEVLGTKWYYPAMAGVEQHGGQEIVHPSMDAVDRTRIKTPREAFYWDLYEVYRRLDIYGSDALMVDNATFFNNGRRGIGKFKVSGPQVRSILGGQLAIENGAGKYSVVEEDVKGHFDKENGLPSLLPGIRTIAIARTTADKIIKGQKLPLHLSRITSVELKKPVSNGTELDVAMSTIPETVDRPHALSAVVSRGDKTIAVLELEYSPTAAIHIPASYVDPEYLTESAAQIALLLMQKQKGLENMDTILPLFGGVEEIEICQSIGREEEVSIDVSLDQSERGFVASATVFKSDGTIAQTIKGMTGIVGEREKMLKLVDRLLR